MAGGKKALLDSGVLSLRELVVKKIASLEGLDIGEVGVGDLEKLSKMSYNLRFLGSRVHLYHEAFVDLSDYLLERISGLCGSEKEVLLKFLNKFRKESGDYLDKLKGEEEARRRIGRR